MPASALNAKHRKFRSLALGGLVFALVGYLSAPEFLGFSLLPLFFALVCALRAGRRAWLELFRSRSGRSFLAVFLAALAAVAVLLAVGGLRTFPVFDFSRDQVVKLAPETVDLLAKLNAPVKITIHLGPQSLRLGQVKNLLSAYQQAASGRLSVEYVNPQTDPAAGRDGPNLVTPDSAEIVADHFRENIAPISEDSLNGALSRLLHPQRRLIYFLNTFGEKMVQNTGPGGLSQWAADLGDRRLLAQDYHWPEGSALPREASALILAGPRAPLGEFREKQLLDYVKNGGQLMVMVDPLTVAVSPDFWKPFGLELPEGLVIDPEYTLAGTGEAFVVSRDYPAHPLTRGLKSPAVWPLAGAFVTLDQGQAELPVTVYALANSSASSWLETEAASFAEQRVRYQAGRDLPGPLALAVAAELENGGRLLALADSDMAANGFRGFEGNRNFSSAAVNWLVDGESVPLTRHRQSQGLALSPISARLVFWLPVVVWPLAVLSLWLVFYRRRRRPAPHRSDD